MESDTPPESAAVHRPERSDLVTGDVSREHWIVPIHGLNCTDPDGTGQAIARRDGTVILDLICGHRNTPLRGSSPMPRRRLNPVNQAASMASMVADETRTIGRRVRQIRHSRGKSLVVLAGLAGISKFTLHRIEHGQRDVTLSEIVALASALEIVPSQLISLPILPPANGHIDAARKAAQALIP